jgi:dienelactone hydrolase
MLCAAPCLVLGLTLLVPIDAPATEKGTVRFVPVGGDAANPERYRLAEHTFDYQMNLKCVLPNSGVDIYKLTFPSPVTSPVPENNTVYAEYYRPHGKGPFPAIIVLDIMGGDQALSRGIAAVMAQNGVGSLFVQMAYYGPRRPAGSRVRLVSPDVYHTMEAIRQTVLDNRRAVAWLESRPEIDAKRLGILGTSLGSFMGGLTAEMEPKLGRVALILGGGGLVDAYYDHPAAATMRKTFELLGGKKEMLAKLIAPVDPLTFADRLKDRKLLMVAASRDDVVPPKAATALWNATGRQEIIWFPTTHVGAALYITAAFDPILKHFTKVE